MPRASVTIVDETDILYNIAELKLLMTNENVSTIVRTNRKNQPSPMTTTREKDRILDHKTTTTQILNTIPTLHKDLVIAIVSRTIETKISAIRIITTRVTLIKDRISELDKITTTFPQGRVTTPIRSPQPDEESNFKSRFHMNVFYFPTGDSKKDSGLEIEFMVDTGAACSIINYRTFCEISQFLQPITVVRSKQKTRTYTGEEIPMLGHTTLNFSFDSDGQHCFQLQLWITETKTANLLGIEFCRKYISKLHFDIPALELKDTANHNLLRQPLCYQTLSLPVTNQGNTDTASDTH